MPYILDHPDVVWQRTLEHLQLVGMAVLIAALIGVPLGILIAKVRWLALPVLNITGVLYTIPSLAFFAIMIPYIGIGRTTATVALAVYSLLVIVRNTAAGLDEVPAAAIDAARGMGMTGFQRLVQVELPLALPYILTGIRIATVAAIGIAVIAAVIAAGGLGRLIFDGIRRVNTDLIVTGSVIAIVLAIVADVLLSRAAVLVRRDLRAPAQEA